MKVPAAGLHGDILLCSDRIRHRGALECRAHIEAPHLLELFVVICDDPTTLEGSEQTAAGFAVGPRWDFDVGYRLGNDLVVDGVESCHRAVVEVAVVRPLLTVLLVDAAVRG